MSIKPVSTTMGVSSPATLNEGTGRYRYRGNKPDPPPPSEPLPQNAKATSAKQQRMAEYDRRRLDGQSKEQAADGIGISKCTMHFYEREFKAQHPQEAADA